LRRQGHPRGRLVGDAAAGRRWAAAVRRHRRVPERRAAQGHPSGDEVGHARGRDPVRVPGERRLRRGAAGRLRAEGGRLVGGPGAARGAELPPGIRARDGGRDVQHRGRHGDRRAGPGAARPGAQRGRAHAHAQARRHGSSERTRGPSRRRRLHARQARRRLSLGHDARRGSAGAPRGGGHHGVRDALSGRVRQPMPALLSGQGLRDGRRPREGGSPHAAHQRFELRALQDLRHRRPVSDHHLDHARGGRRSGLQAAVRPMAMRPTSALPLRHLRTLAAALALASTLSCAVGGVVSDAPSMPAARAALRPEFRIFYDALVDYGDWVLIEPYGFVFRPKVDFATFHPYADGFWAPSDSWGWVWISAEPFGWATYHYGNWFWDRYQGWVWSPGPNWGPA